MHKFVNFGVLRNVHTKEPLVDNEWVRAGDDFGKVGWSDLGKT